MNSSCLAKLTLVIPTYNRKNYALRNMRYWSGQGATVLVMDGSDSPIPTHELAGIDNNVHYHHENCSIEERLAVAATHINTKYAMICGDDEFQIFSGLIACIQFLEANDGYMSCCGRCVGFRVQESKVELFPVKDYHKNHLVSQDSIGDRIKYHIGNFMVTTIYGVHRRDSFKYCLSGASKKYSSIYVGETSFELLSSAYGKSIVLPNATWLRSFENEPIQTNNCDRQYRISQWYDDPLRTEEVCRFYSDIKKSLYSLCPIDERKIVWESACYALKIRLNRDRAAITGLSSRPSLTLALRLFVLRVIPVRLRYSVKLALQKLRLRDRFSFYTDCDNYSYKELKDKQGIDINDGEISAIMERILKFHEKPS